MLVGAVSSGALASASFLVVRSSRLRSSLERDLQRAQANLFVASAALDDRTEARDVEALFKSYRRHGSFETVAEFRHNVQTSDPSIASFSAIPADVKRPRGADEIAYQRVTLEGEPYLIVGGKVFGSDGRLYFFFSEAGLQRSISQLGTVLLTGWILVVVVSGVVGILLSRRMLRPVARASAAARSLAEGLLDTRLPVETKDEFGAWAMSFNEMAQALQHKINELSQARERERRFTANVAHELRTPVGALVSEASLLREHLDALPTSASRPAQLLVEDVARLRELLDDLMEMYRLHSGRETLALETVDLAAVVDAVIARRGWDAMVDVDAAPLRMRSDRRRLERIASNLIGNAVKHGGRDVRVRVQRRDGVAVLEVSDGGPGIPPEHLGHLFEPFYKADASRTGVGAGLGLNIADENVRLLGGSIDVSSVRGEGATFTVEIPLGGGGSGEPIGGRPARPPLSAASSIADPADNLS